MRPNWQPQLSTIFAAGMLASSALAGQELPLAIGRAEVLRLERRAATVVLADPNIADVTTISDSTLVVTAKRAGHTSLIVFDDQGRQVLQREIRVEAPGPVRRVRLYKGLSNGIEEYRCSPTECIATVAPRSDPSPNKTTAPEHEQAPHESVAPAEIVQTPGRQP